MAEIGNAKKALIHVARTALGLDDQAYRQMLLNVAGVTSSKDLSETGFRKVMKHFERCGFQSSNYRPAPAGRSRPGMATIDQINKIYALWWCLAGTGYYREGQELTALRGFLHSRFGISDVKFLTFEKAGAVIEAVKAIGRRRKCST